MEIKPGESVKLTVDDLDHDGQNESIEFHADASGFLTGVVHFSDSQYREFGFDTNLFIPPAQIADSSVYFTDGALVVRKKFRDGSADDVSTLSVTDLQRNVDTYQGVLSSEISGQIFAGAVPPVTNPSGNIPIMAFFNTDPHKHTDGGISRTPGQKVEHDRIDEHALRSRTSYLEGDWQGKPADGADISTIGNILYHQGKRINVQLQREMARQQLWDQPDRILRARVGFTIAKDGAIADAHIVALEIIDKKGSTTGIEPTAEFTQKTVDGIQRFSCPNMRAAIRVETYVDEPIALPPLK